MSFMGFMDFIEWIFPARKKCPTTALAKRKHDMDFGIQITECGFGTRISEKMAKPTGASYGEGQPTWGSNLSPSWNFRLQSYYAQLCVMSCRSLAIARNKWDVDNDVCFELRLRHLNI
jgi:hypothetical protein